MVHLYAIRSIQAYVQEIGRYRGSEAGAMCLSVLTDSYVMQLYSSCFTNYATERTIRAFLQYVMDTEATGNFISFRWAEQHFDLAELIQRTLLILLESRGVLSIDSEFFNHFTVTPYSHDTVSVPLPSHSQLMRTNPFYASLVTYSNTYDVNQSRGEGSGEE